VSNDYKIWLGKKVKVIIDRPLGLSHPKYPNTVYSINYGYIPDTVSPADNEEIDVYILGEDKPLKTFEGKVLAVVDRGEDSEIKLVVTDGTDYPIEEIEKQINFVEKFHLHKIYK
jgi:inorganic pyrophosphatase